MDGLSIFLQISAGALLLAVYHPILLGFGLGFGLAHAFVLYLIIKFNLNSARRSAEAESTAKYQIIDQLAGGIQDPQEMEPGVLEYLEERKKHFSLWFR